MLSTDDISNLRRWLADSKGKPNEDVIGNYLLNRGISKDSSEKMSKKFAGSDRQGIEYFFQAIENCSDNSALAAIVLIAGL